MVGYCKPLIQAAMDIVLKDHQPENKYAFNWILDNGKFDANNGLALAIICGLI